MTLWDGAVDAMPPRRTTAALSLHGIAAVATAPFPTSRARNMRSALVGSLAQKTHRWFVLLSTHNGGGGRRVPTRASETTFFLVMETHHTTGLYGTLPACHIVARRRFYHYRLAPPALRRLVDRWYIWSVDRFCWLFWRFSDLIVQSFFKTTTLGARSQVIFASTARRVRLIPAPDPIMPFPS